MPTPFESATLNLKLFDLRREPVLREARQWFIAEFHPQSYADVVATVGGPRNPSFRMVIGYWDMAASMVTSGAIDGDAFRAAHGEIFGAFSKIQPFLAEMRTTMSEPTFCQHFEAVAMGGSDAQGIIDRRRARLRAMWERRQQAEAATAKV